MTTMKKSVSGAGRGRPRQFDRDEALGQALSLFWRYGYSSTSISALTEAMAITAPSLYAAFGSKEQLFYEAVDRYADTHGALLYAPLQGAGSAHDAVHGLLAGAAALFSAKGNPAGCFLMTGTSCSADCAYIEDTLRERRKEKEQALQACIQQGIQRGELPPGTDAAALAKFFNTVMQGMPRWRPWRLARCWRGRQRRQRRLRRQRRPSRGKPRQPNVRARHQAAGSGRRHNHASTQAMQAIAP